MNILVTLNRGYLYQLCVMLSSLIKSNPDTEFDVYVMNASLTEADFEAVRQRIPADKCRLIDIKTWENEFADAPMTDTSTNWRAPYLGPRIPTSCTGTRNVKRPSSPV